jgi:hypothetical protein
MNAMFIERLENQTHKPKAKAFGNWFKFFNTAHET